MRHGPCDAALAACALLAAVALLPQCWPVVVADAAAASQARRHEKRVRPRPQPMVADQPHAAAGADDEYDDNGNYDGDDEYDENDNGGYRRRPVTTASTDAAAAADRRTDTRYSVILGRGGGAYSAAFEI